VVKHANQKSVTYSSWERFKVLRVNNHDITSDLSLKLEFVIQLPNTPRPQRCIVNVLLDSSLPIIHKHKEKAEEAEALGFLFVIMREWNSVKISIDFVDFLIAKSFTTNVEEWFTTLKKTPIKKYNRFLLRYHDVFRTTLGQFGRIGMAAYLGAYAFFSRGDLHSLYQITSAVSVGLLIWASIVIFETTMMKHLFRRISSNIVPTIILLTDADDSAYTDVREALNSPVNTLFGFIGTIALSLTLNVLASYLFTYFSKP
jgi:hypothetical protein